MRHGLKLLFLLLASVTLVAADPLTGRAEDFRVDTEIFVGSERKPSAEVLTIYQNGNVYDFQLTDPKEITVYEPRRGVVTLIKPEKHQKATLTTVELLNASLDVQAAALAQNDKPEFVAAAKPVFELTASEFKENGSNFAKLTFAGMPIQYTVTGQKARHPAAANEYRFFSDLSARLSSLRAGLPAGARLEVNAAIANAGLLPTKVERVIQVNRFSRKLEIRTQHLVVWTLSQEDLKRIDLVGDHLSNPNCKLVAFEEFCGRVRTAAK